jgi:hypothetical protein
MRHVLRLLVVSLVLCLSVCTVSGGAQEDIYDALFELNSLMDLKGVAVVVKNLEPHVKETGLTSIQLKTDVELRLRKAGIPVLNDWDWAQTPETPYLYVNVNIHSITDKTTGYGPFLISVQLREWVNLRRKHQGPVRAITWDASSIVTAVTGGLRRAVHDNVGDMVDEFCNGWLLTNPKREPDAPSGESN